MYQATLCQCCLVQAQCAVMSRLLTRALQDVQTDMTGMWKQEALLKLAAFQVNSQQRSPGAVHRLMENDAQLLTFPDVPRVMHRSTCTTGASKRLLSNVCQRTN
jgi:transposase-like protein